MTFCDDLVTKNIHLKINLKISLKTDTNCIENYFLNNYNFVSTHHKNKIQTVLEWLKQEKEKLENMHFLNQNKL